MAEGTEALTEILESALNGLEEGIAILDLESRVLFWNPAAESISGYLGADLLSRGLPINFFQIDPQHQPGHGRVLKAHPGAAERPILVYLHHKQGHPLPALLRRTPLRNALEKRIATLYRFRPVDEIDSLPHGVTDENDVQEMRVEQCQADMEDRLEEAWREWSIDRIPLGLLWISVDQAVMLRKTHGRDASEAMLAIVERALLHGLRPSEILGRWGTTEFLVICHERTVEMLDAHAHHVGGLARTADFRWWGDRVSLTVSIGAAQANEGETLRCLMKRAQQGMQESAYAGGNKVIFKRTANSGGIECSQS